MVTKTATRSLTLHCASTPLGLFAILADGEAVYGAGFTASGEELARYAGIDPIRVRKSAGGHGALTAVRGYFAGDLGALERIEVVDRLGIGPFTSAARAALRKIPAGTTATYTQLAAMAGNPRANRAAGSACATNPIALIVPCHRVVRADGLPGGYLYGFDVKRALLEHEQTHAGSVNEN
jgi:methylated-DNA-[protein]-cysteine S-methyltransferase